MNEDREVDALIARALDERLAQSTPREPAFVQRLAQLEETVNQLVRLVAHLASELTGLQKRLPYKPFPGTPIVYGTDPADDDKPF